MVAVPERLHGMLCCDGCVVMVVFHVGFVVIVDSM